MKNDFDTLSREVRMKIDANWETLDIALPVKKIISWTSDNVSVFTTNYTQQEKDIARDITSKLWEEALCYILWWKKAKKLNNKWYDIISGNWTRIEVKTWRIRNVTVIKDKQLEQMSHDNFFGLVFYRTRNNFAPSYFVSKCKHINPQSFLKRNIFIESVFLFPKSVIVYFYNTFRVNERDIWKTWVKYKPLWFTNAKLLFEENHWNFTKNKYEKQYWKHNIMVYTLWYGE